jgi:hypothetical protein
MFGDNYSKKKWFSPGKIAFFIGMAVLFVFVLGSVVMLLWNAILPDLVGVKPIRFWQAIGLLILSRILFGGFRFGDKAKKHHARRKQWKEKWASMSEEERAEFKERWRRKC